MTKGIARAALGALLAGVAIPAIAQAQTAQPQSGQPAPNPAQPDAGAIQDIVVTAQKRSQNVQDVPISISAFSADSLSERQVNSVSALANVAPNVTLDAGTPFSGSSAVLAAFIRGIGSDDFAFNIDPGVGLYIDGVYLARSVGANQDLADVERIEILKGPQGTLFGRNTIGGAISIVTRDPGNSFMFSGDVTAGSYNRLDVRGTMDIPIAEGLNSSFSFSSKSRGGYMQRIPIPTSARSTPIRSPASRRPAIATMIAKAANRACRCAAS